MRDELWHKAMEDARVGQFKLGATLPISWKYHSLLLRHAASRLYELQYDANLRIIRAQLELKPGEKTDSIRTLEGPELLDHQDAQLISVYFLLMGYAIENLLKGILILQHPEYFKPTGKMEDIKTHDLSGLCRRCGIQFEDTETLLLDTLHTHIEWMGKYPIPLDGDKMWPIKQADGTWKQVDHAFDGMETYQRIDSLYTKTWRELDRIQGHSSEDLQPSTGA